jgi:ribose transport system permease protein
VAVVSFVALEYLPFGRYLHAVGANPRAARLVGIPVRRCVIGAFVGSGALTALVGVALAARLQIAQSSIGLEYLLPAFVGALLGSTTFRPGRVNVPGTLVAVLLLAVGVSGLQQLGTSYFVEPLFNGLTLIAAVVLAAYGQRRRSGADAHERADSRLDNTESSPAGPGAGAGERGQGEEGAR